jgi:imidazolonepropionase-like amidohydrolase
MYRTALLLVAALPLTAQVQPLIFDQVDVFDGYRMLRSQTVVVQHGIIQEMRPSTGHLGAGTAINGRGKTLLPGLIDAHCHIAGEESLEQAAALGITTELDMFGFPDVLMPIRKALARGEYPNAADFRTAGIGANVPGGHPSEMMPGAPPFPTLAKGADPQAFVDARLAEGSDYLKILYDHTLPGLTFDELRALVAAAHRRNKLAAVHETVQHDGLEAIEAGADEIEHVFDDSPIAPEFVRLAVENHVTVTPTLAVISTFGGAGTGPELAPDPRFARYLLSWAPDILNTKLPKEVVQKHRYENAQAAVRALHQAGVPILVGTDAPNPGTTYGASVHAELALLVACGLTPLEALHGATAAPAREFGLIDRGRIEAGRRADLLLIEGDPSRDIRATRSIVGVWKEGRAIDRAAVANKLGHRTADNVTAKPDLKR